MEINTKEYLPDGYPGPRGFLLFFIGKFCGANRFLYIFSWHEALLGASISASRRKFPNEKKDNIKRKPLGPGYPMAFR